MPNILDDQVLSIVGVLAVAGICVLSLMWVVLMSVRYMHRCTEQNTRKPTLDITTDVIDNESYVVPMSIVSCPSPPIYAISNDDTHQQVPSETQYGMPCYPPPAYEESPAALHQSLARL